MTHLNGRPPENDDIPREFRRQPSAMFLFHRLFSVWWIAQAAGVICTTWLTAPNWHLVNPTSGETICSIVLRGLILYASAFASNTYFLCAVASTNGSAAVVRFTWRVRLLIDLLVMLLLSSPGM